MKGDGENAGWVFRRRLRDAYLILRGYSLTEGVKNNGRASKEAHFRAENINFIGFRLRRRHLVLRLLRHSQTHSAAVGALPLAQTLPLLS